MKYPHRILCLIFCLLAISLPVMADDSPIDPNATIADQVLEGVVTGVRGMVQIRQSENDPWVKAEAGMKLTQGAEFRTGPRSAVQFKIPPDQTVTLDRLGTVKLLTAVAERKKIKTNLDAINQQTDVPEHIKIKTDLGMTYGRTRYDIQKAGFEHESTIRSPSATLSVRGTRVGIQDGAMGFHAWSTQSRARVYDQNRRQNMTFGENTHVDGQSNGAADTMKKSGAVDPGDIRGRDGGEGDLVLGRPGFDPHPGGGDPNFGPGQRPHDPFAPVQHGFDNFASGQLRFELMWSNYETNSQSDLDLSVKSPAPGDVTIGTFDLPRHNLTGGVAGADVSNGNPYATEIVQWNGPTFPTGTYTVGVTGFSVIDGLGDPTSQPYTVIISAKKLTDEYFTTLHYINDSIPDNVVHEHDVVITTINPIDSESNITGP